ncbi:uncharacterized protein METZ01_LOCUS261817, partial [marine metagenome]
MVTDSCKNNTLQQPSTNPQPSNGRVIEQFGDFLGGVWDQTQLARVNDRSENGRNKMSGIVGIRYRFAP